MRVNLMLVCVNLSLAAVYAATGGKLFVAIAVLNVLSACVCSFFAGSIYGTTRK